MDLPRGKSELVAENALLWQQLIILRRQIKRPHYAQTDHILPRSLSPFRKPLKGFQV
jgi:hypothetical protein